MAGHIGLNQNEMNKLKEVIEDLNYIFTLDEIDVVDVDNVIGKLRSLEVKSYIQNLCAGSRPETALREALFAVNSILGKYLYGYASAPPEVMEDGFVDYLIKDRFGHIIILELKSPFDSVKERDRAGRIMVRRLKQQRLNWEAHREQIKKYIMKGEYVVLTNLKEWVFFSRSLNPIDPKPFYSTTLAEFIKEYEVIGNLKDYADRREYQSVRYELDRKFLESLKKWVMKLSEAKFNVDDERKIELIIGLINKFIFIQTLDDYGVIDFKWILRNWEHYNNAWISKGKLKVLEEFFKMVNEWFYSYYDTELFRENVMDYIEKSEENIDLFYNSFRMVLGLTYLQTPIEFKGIMQYNFRLIDEDVLGKAYEIFLAERRREKGAYYTPKYITEYIVENTVGKIYDELLKEIRTSLESEEFDKSSELIKKFTSIKVLDPACGSGSFLIKALRKIKSKYDELNEIVKGLKGKYMKYYSSFELLQKVQDKLNRISKIENMIGPGGGRELISRLILRHIHGVDLDRRALEVAKVNIWLEAIKLSPSEFRFDRLPSRAEHILPDLQMNFGNGDSLIGLPEDLTVEMLSKKHKDDVVKLFRLRQKYLEDPTNPEFVEEIEEIKNKLRKELNEEFNKYLREKNLPLEIFDRTRPFHWALEFWHVFFNESGIPLPEEWRGFEVVIGNPPYVENKRLNLEIKKYLQTCGRYKSAYKLFDYAVPFIERALQLLNIGGLFGYIITNKFTVTDYGIRIREILAKNTKIDQMLDVSYLPVFKGTAIYPMILIFTKIKPPDDHEVIIAPKVSSENDIIENKYKFIKTKQKAILQTPGYIFDISGNIALREKILSLATVSLKEIVSIGYRVLRFTDWDELLDYVVDQKPHTPHVKFIGCGNIEPYFINWDSKLRLAGRTFKSSYLVKTSQVDENKWRILEMPKILIREVGTRLTAAFDQNGEYGNLTGMYALYDLDQKYEPRYLLALLNSSLLDFYYKSLYGSTHMAGGYLNFHGSYIENLPIIPATASQQKFIAELVSKIEVLKNAHHKLRAIWMEWCTRLKNGECSLYAILSEDARLIREGEFNKAWTSKVTSYPTESMPNTIFNSFKVVGEVGRHVIRIYGLDEDNRERLVYEMEFNNRELMLHIYYSLLQALESRAKIKNLPQLFTKTTIPIIKEVNRSPNELTPNIVRKATDEFKRWLNEEKIGFAETDIVKIDNEIEDVEAEIDALVFKLYGLEENEVKVVFDSLKTPTIYQRKVIDYFRRLEL